MKLVIAVSVSILLLMFSVRVDAAPLLLGTLNHPQISKHESIIRHAYKEIGVDVEFITTTVGRRLISSNDGLLDGLVVGIKGLNNNYSNLLEVGPPLSSVTTYLLCLKGVPCDKSVLFSTDKTVITDPRAAFLLEQEYQQKISAKVFEVQRLGVVLDLLKHKRAQYATFALDDSQDMPTDILLVTNRVPLHQMNLHHYLNEKHQQLATKLSGAIIHQLELAKQTTN